MKQTRMLFAMIALDMTAEIRAGAATFPGKVRSVSPEVVDGNVATRLVFGEQRPAGLRQNQRLTARILIEERPNVLMVARGPSMRTSCSV
jgi:HlyD family secretion protein